MPAGAGMARLEGALAGEDPADHPTVRAEHPDEPVGLAIGHHGAARGIVVDAGAGHRVPQLRQAALDHAHQPAAAAEVEPGPLDEDHDALRGGRGDLRGGGMGGAQRDPAPALGAHPQRERSVGRRHGAPQADAALGTVDADLDRLPGGRGGEHAAHQVAIAAQHDEPLAVAQGSLGRDGERPRRRRRRRRRGRRSGGGRWSRRSRRDGILGESRCRREQREDRPERDGGPQATTACERRASGSEMARTTITDAIIANSVHASQSWETPNASELLSACSTMHGTIDFVQT